ncbi:MAG TPA: metal ABC transporter substrate-binding protein [Candidatus Limnocylindrales bacterium]|nr:metal ABC transporter substrate-binding protein [Candidatus Limnocylindrales bacterium]
MRLRALATAASASLLLAACAGVAPSSSPGGPLPVVASTTVFADLVANVGGHLVSVSSIVPRNGDVHTYSPTPNDARLIASARIAFMNGLGLDDWLDERVRDIGSSAEIVKLAPGLPGVDLIGGEDEANPNPHLWLDVSYAEGYVDRIGNALAAVDPRHAAAYRANADAYGRRLADLDTETAGRLASIPAADRRIVSFHDSLPYFARRYGLTIVGVAVEAPGQDPSAAEIGRLVDAIRATHVRAIFAEAQFPPRLLEQIATETGAAVVATLYDDSLGDPPVTSYESLVRWDTGQIVQALG